tara:strand:- start:77 stop:853 length:777 start_codon:yes stop_codon:yes gene_type:complete
MTNAFDTAINEAFSNASYMNVTDIRTLYYGRLDLYASFTDDGDIETSGITSGRLERPAGVLAHKIDSIVGRKVSSSLFYASIFRWRRQNVFVDDIRNHTYEKYQDDLEVFRTLKYIKDEVKEAAEKAAESSLLRSYFERLWVLTKTAAEGSGSISDQVWARILEDLGYAGFADPSGKGIIVKDRVPCVLIIDDTGLTEIDIVPIQKYRIDRRMRIVDKVNRKVRKMATKRNRIAKRKFKDREEKTEDGLSLFDLLMRL